MFYINQLKNELCSGNYLYCVISGSGDYILKADKLMTLLVGLLIALGGWSLSRTFELSTIQAVHED